MEPFGWSFPYAWPRKPVLARDVVVTSQPLAAQAGLAMLAAGGNAVDAAVAAAITLTIVEPTSNGIGSDAFAMVWDGQTLHGLNGSGRSPATWTPELFGEAGVPAQGWGSVTVPGCVAAWRSLSERFGKLPFERLFAPAIRYGREGFLVSPVIAKAWAQMVPDFKSQPGFAEAFMPHGRAPQAGELFRLPEHASSLEAIALTKGEAFYRGELAERIETHAKKHGGHLRVSDLAEHQSEWVAPLEKQYRSCTVHELPPNGQGLVALIAMGILERFEVASLPPDSSESLHLQIEAVKLAFADALAYVADPAHMPFAPSTLLDPSYLNARAALIDRKKAQAFAAGTPPRGGTVYLAAGDSEGMMVSLIQSNYMGFGSGVVIPGTGISLQNRGSTFVTTQGHPNRVGPRKRPYQTIIPGFVTRAGKPLASFGVVGGTLQPQAHVQLLTRLIDHGQNPQAACDAPRFRWIRGQEVHVEAGLASSVRGALAEKGHVIKVVDDTGHFGSGQVLWRLDAGYCAASDSRRDGLAAGV